MDQITMFKTVQSNFILLVLHINNIECFSLYSFTCRTLKFHNRHWSFDHKDVWSFTPLMSLNIYDVKVWTCVLFLREVLAKNLFSNRAFLKYPKIKGFKLFDNNLLYIYTYKWTCQSRKYCNLIGVASLHIFCPQILTVSRSVYRVWNYQTIYGQEPPSTRAITNRQVHVCITSYRSLEKNHRWIFSCEICLWWNIFVPWSLQWIKNITFFFIVKCVQFSSCYTSDENFLMSNFSQTTVCNWICD